MGNAERSSGLRCPDCLYADADPRKVLAHMDHEHATEHPEELPWVDAEHAQSGWTERALLDH
jgi:hypothetical protein